MNINNYKSNLSLVSILHNIDFKGNKKKYIYWQMRIVQKYSNVLLKNSLKNKSCALQTSLAIYQGWVIETACDLSSGDHYKTKSD